MPLSFACRFSSRLAQPQCPTVGRVMEQSSCTQKPWSTQRRQGSASPVADQAADPLLHRFREPSRATSVPRLPWPRGPVLQCALFPAVMSRHLLIYWRGRLQSWATDRKHPLGMKPHFRPPHGLPWVADRTSPGSVSLPTACSCLSALLGFPHASL